MGPTCRHFSRMACDLASQCNFLYGFFQCNFPEDTIAMEIMVRMMKGVHTFKKDCNNQTALCSPWGLQVHPFPFLVKNGNIFGRKKKYCRPFHPIHTYPNRPTRSLFAKAQIPKKKKTGEARKQLTMRRLGEPFLPSKAAMPTFTLASMPTQALLPPPWQPC